MKAFPDTTQPPAVNDLGVKWWPWDYMTKYARDPDIHGVCLPDVSAFLCEEPSGERTYVLAQGGEIEYADQKLEGIACHIDMMKVVKQHDT